MSETLPDYRADSEALVELLSLEPLPDNPDDTLEWLRIMSESNHTVLDRCPECGVSLEDRDIIAHAQGHYPTHVPRSLMSAEALKREAALYRAAKAEPPNR